MSNEIQRHGARWEVDITITFEIVVQISEAVWFRAFLKCINIGGLQEP